MSTETTKAAEEEKLAKEKLKALMLEHKILACEFEDDEGDEVEIVLEEHEATLKMRTTTEDD